MASASKFVDRSNWTIFELKQELRKRKATTTGRKAVLVARLEDYDRNFDFVLKDSGIIPAPDPICNWPENGFQQIQPIHKHFLPALSREMIEGYFKYRLATDNEECTDIKALQKGKLLLESEHISACSLRISKEDVFLTGIVRASMKKRVSYNYKIRLSTLTGEVCNTHCECPAGRGPHGTCKHLAAVLLMLNHFISNNEIKVAKSCTENPQSFHKPRLIHSGSPVKAEQLTCKRKSALTDEDPRPKKFRNMPGYENYVRNLIVNYCSNHSEDLTMRFLYQKANIQSAVLDHDYLVLPFTEYWIDNSNQVTEEQAAVIEMKTRAQYHSQLWFSERKFRLTASRFGEICKITSRRNKQKLCESLLTKCNLKSKAILHGRMYESTCIKCLENVLNFKVEHSGFHVSTNYSFLGASPDGVVDKDTIIEVKCPYQGRNSLITPGKFFPFLYSDNGICKLKESSNYYYQVQGQLFISKRTYCYFAIYTFNDFFYQKIEIDENFCQNSLIPKLSLFWVKYMRPYIASKF